MPTERPSPIQAEQPESSREREELSEFSIEPKTTPSLSEAVEKGKVEFLTILKTSDVRTLVQYIEKAGLKIAAIEEIPDSWRSYFRTKTFRNSPYTWRNPNLYLVADRVVSRLALHELMARIGNQESPRA